VQDVRREATGNRSPRLPAVPREIRALRADADRDAGEWSMSMDDDRPAWITSESRPATDEEIGAMIMLAITQWQQSRRPEERSDMAKYLMKLLRTVGRLP
jgi:hypothetical protein